MAGRDAISLSEVRRMLASITVRLEDVIERVDRLVEAQAEQEQKMRRVEVEMGEQDAAMAVGLAGVIQRLYSD